MIPFQSVVLIEELKSDRAKSKVMPFGLVGESSQASE